MAVQLALRSKTLIGQLLWEARLEKGKNGKPLPVRFAARDLDCTDGCYNKWETGEWEPDLQRNKGLLQRLSAFLGRSELEILVALGILQDVSPKALGPGEEELAILDRIRSLRSLGADELAREANGPGGNAKQQVRGTVAA